MKSGEMFLRCCDWEPEGNTGSRKINGNTSGEEKKIHFCQRRFKHDIYGRAPPRKIELIT